MARTFHERRIFSCCLFCCQNRLRYLKRNLPKTEKFRISCMKQSQLGKRGLDLVNKTLQGTENAQKSEKISDIFKESSHKIDTFFAIASISTKNGSYFVNKRHQAFENASKKREKISDFFEESPQKYFQ